MAPLQELTTPWLLSKSQSTIGVKSSTQILALPAPFTLVIGDTGVASPTGHSVGDVRRAWSQHPEMYEAIFDQIGNIVQQARRAIETGEPYRLGPLMDENHAWLQRLAVSSPELDYLVDIARQAGALGAKLSGGGRGGNMIALVKPELAQHVAQALQDRSAVRTLITEIRQPGVDIEP